MEFSHLIKNNNMGNNNTNSGQDSLSTLHDSAGEADQLKPEIVTIDLPDVTEIPGQEKIAPAPFGELADVTISSADEEGNDIFDDNPDELNEEDADSNVSAAEKEDLEDAAMNMPTEDDINLRKATLDDTDEEGTPLNEGSFKRDTSGSDLDVPGSEEDDAGEEIGAEDEENNPYSLGGENHDEIPGDNL